MCRREIDALSRSNSQNIALANANCIIAKAAVGAVNIRTESRQPGVRPDAFTTIKQTLYPDIQIEVTIGISR